MKSLTKKDISRQNHVGIGIDSGGTFTDGVMIDLTEGKIIRKFKVRTTHENLLLGIRSCMEYLRPDEGQHVAALSLSTTLATNAVVEGKGAKVGVFLVGQKKMGEIPSPYCYAITGGHDSQGVPLEDLDIGKAKEIVRKIKNEVSAFAVSATMSVRNPEHELRLKELIMEESGLPVICGHELTSSLGAHERAVTATLNARLIPVIKELILAVRQSMKEEGIDAPLMLVKGDGSLALADMILDRPIETMLSGPAASMIGATYLTSFHDAIIMDIGGTTTDTALIENGLPKINPDGALVGGFLTRVKAAEIRTEGLGGDSYICFDKESRMKIGPRRVVPVSVIAQEYPYLMDELHRQLAQNPGPHHRSLRHQAVDIVWLPPTAKMKTGLSPKMEAILKEGPHTVYHIANCMETDIDFISFGETAAAGGLCRASLTPTDLKNYTNEIVVGEPEASRLALEITARMLNLSINEIIVTAFALIDEKIVSILLAQIMGGKNVNCCSQCDFIPKNLVSQSSDEYSIQVSVKKPVIAVGAPAHCYFPDAIKKIDAQLVIPENAEVANAVGAISGQIAESVEIIIRPDGFGGYTLFAPWEKRNYPDMELNEIKAIAEKNAAEYVKNQAEQAGGHNIKVFVDTKDVKVHSVFSTEEKLYIEGRVQARAIGEAYKKYLKQ